MMDTDLFWGTSYRVKGAFMPENTERNLAAAIDKLTLNVEELRKTIEFLTKAIKDQMHATALAGR